MENKTCGECQHCKDKQIIATCKHIGVVTGNVPACGKFEPKPMTNGDKIRQGGDDALVKYRQKFICHVCAYRFDKKCNGAKCKDGLVAWLNAPAESEGEDA